MGDPGHHFDPTLVTVMAIGAAFLGVGESCHNGLCCVCFNDHMLFMTPALLAYFTKRVLEAIEAMTTMTLRMPLPVLEQLTSGSRRLPTTAWFDEFSGFGIRTLLRQGGSWIIAPSFRWEGPHHHRCQQDRGSMHSATHWIVSRSIGPRVSTSSSFIWSVLNDEITLPPLAETAPARDGNSFIDRETFIHSGS